MDSPIVLLIIGATVGVIGTLTALAGIATYVTLQAYIRHTSDQHPWTTHTDHELAALLEDD